MRVLVVDEDSARTSGIAQMLGAAGHEIVGTLRVTDDVRRAVQSLDPDLIIVDVETPYRDYLDSLVSMNQEQPRPIAMFVANDDQGLTARALDSGVMVYAVDGVSPKLVQSVLQVAVSQFDRYRKLDAELRKSQTALSERKVIDRAKGLLMTHRGLSEDEAYRTLRGMAMSQNKRLIDIAEAVLALASVLKS